MKPNRQSAIGNRQCSAILLSAGQSKRMSAFKPLLPFGDMTVVEACVHVLKEGGVDEIVVVLGHRAEEVQRQIEHLNVRFAFNRKAESEMSESIACGVKEISPNSNSTFITLVDQPAVPPKVITQLIQARDITKARLIVPTYQNRGGHPVLIDLSLKDELLSLDSQKSLRGLLEKYADEILRLEVASPFIRRDIDTWEDYRNLYMEIFGTEPPIQASR
jgi:CTP:molybdopterin cytidylyltransferase MocA